MVRELVFVALMLRAPTMPLPDKPVDKFGCTADEIAPAPGIMPGWMVHVWAEIRMERPEWHDKWSRLLGVRPLPDPKARTKALRDCDQWMKLMDEKVKEERRATER